jgi:hypothetical protein
MYESGVKRPGAMAAILGEMSRPIEEVCLQASQEAGLVVTANYNCPGQLVISGEGRRRRARDGVGKGSRRQACDPAQRERRVSLAPHGRRFIGACRSTEFSGV